MPPHIEIANQQNRAIDQEVLVEVARQILADSLYANASISIAIVDDSAIHDLNRRFLEHDYPTDVLSFPLERNESEGVLNGEVIVSADTAAARAGEFGWDFASELALYVIHGLLHLVGHDDKSESARSKMQAAETEYLRRIGIER